MSERFLVARTTVTSQVALSSPKVAVTVALPILTEVIFPLSSTRTTMGSELDHSTSPVLLTESVASSYCSISSSAGVTASFPLSPHPGREITPTAITRAIHTLKNFFIFSSFSTVYSFTPPMDRLDIIRSCAKIKTIRIGITRIKQPASCMGVLLILGRFAMLYSYNP